MGHDYLPENFVKLQYYFSNKDKRKANTFKYYELPTMGLGPEGKSFVELDRYLDLSDLDKVREEYWEGIGKPGNHLVHMVPFGLVPRRINNGEKCLDSYLMNLSKYQKKVPPKAVENLGFHDMKRYYLNYFNLTKSWRRVLHLRKPLPFYQKNEASDWNSSIENFPRLKKLIEGLPFKHMGIALIFRSNEDSPLIIHRDSYTRMHSSHHINISLSKESRKTFIYNSITKQREYLPNGIMSYTFNETDLHGADPQFDHLVLRVDGRFDDAFAKKIGLEDGVSFDWQYDKPQEFIRQVGKIKIWEHTDI